MDFHSILGKLRSIESLGTTGFVAEETSCNMTAEGDFCPVHGMSECTGYALEECNMTAEGEHCPTHGLAECPGYVMGEMEIDPTTLHVSEQEPTGKHRAVPTSYQHEGLQSRIAVALTEAYQDDLELLKSMYKKIGAPEDPTVMKRILGILTKPGGKGRAVLAGLIATMGSITDTGLDPHDTMSPGDMAYRMAKGLGYSNDQAEKYSRYIDSKGPGSAEAKQIVSAYTATPDIEILTVDPQTMPPMPGSAAATPQAKAAGTPLDAYEPKAKAAGTPLDAYEPKIEPDAMPVIATDKPSTWTAPSSTASATSPATPSAPSAAAPQTPSDIERTQDIAVPATASTPPAPPATASGVSSSSPSSTAGTASTQLPSIPNAGGGMSDKKGGTPTGQAASTTAPGKVSGATGSDVPVSAPKPASAPNMDDLTFKQAFARARQRAKDLDPSDPSRYTFMWRGKPYQTNIQGSGTASAPEEPYVPLKKQKGYMSTAPIPNPYENPGMGRSKKTKRAATVGEADQQPVDMTLRATRTVPPTGDTGLKADLKTMTTKARASGKSLSSIAGAAFNSGLNALLAAYAVYDAYQEISKISADDPDWHEKATRIAAHLVDEYGVPIVAMYLGALVGGAVTGGPGSIPGIVAGLGAGVLAQVYLGDSTKEIVDQMVDTMFDKTAANRKTQDADDGSGLHSDPDIERLLGLSGSTPGIQETTFAKEVKMSNTNDRDSDMRAILDTVNLWNTQSNLVSEDYDALGNYFPGTDDPVSSEQPASKPSINWAAGQQMPIGKTPNKPTSVAKAAGTPTAAYEPKAQAAGTPTAAYEPKAAQAPDAKTASQATATQPAMPSWDSRSKSQTANAATPKPTSTPTPTAAAEPKTSTASTAIKTPDDVERSQAPDVSGVTVPATAAAQAAPSVGQTQATTPQAPTAPAPTPPATAAAPADSMSFKDAFARARKAARGGQGVFTWKGKQYQTNVKGEPFLPPNKLKPVQIGEADISAREPDMVDPLVAKANADYEKAKTALIKGKQPVSTAAGTDDEIQFPGDSRKYKKQSDGTYKLDIASMDAEIEFPGEHVKYKRQPDGTYKLDVASMDDEIQFPGDPMKYKKQADGSYKPEGVTNEDVFGAPFAPLGATNNGPETDGYVYANFTEGLTINTTRDMRDGKVTKTLNINATDEDAESLAAVLRNAGLGMEVSAHKPDHGMRCDGCGLPVDQCHCASHEATMENADHDYGHDEKSEAGEPLEVEDYIWDGPHINQRFGKIGDNTLMYEQRASELFKVLSEDYAAMLNEAELEPSNAGFDSPLTANSRDTFDKDPFSGDEAVTDGSHSPLSTIKRQDVMN